MKKQLTGMIGLGIAFIICCNGCKDKKTSPGKTEDDTTGVDISERHDSIVNHVAPPDTAKTFVITPENKDSVLSATTKEILTLFKNKDYAKLDSFIHPQEGVRFSPYATIDPREDKKFTKEEFAALVTKNKGQKINWGNYDGSGNPILLSPAAYFDKFVYDGNFLAPQKEGVNKVLGDGNSLNNLKTAYPGADFTESYLHGSKKNGGIDWKSVRLVYKLVNGRYYLVGVVHDQWTI